LKPIIGIVSILTFVDNFNAFDVIYAMAGARGEPSYSTDLLATLFYRTGIAGEHPVGIPNMGMGAAIATVTFFILMAGVLLWLYLSRRNAEEA
jgi:raffinose/stachyose/melibiose transport system permease protein